ncbi:MAG TPA: thiamine phosphate synthase [Sphingomonas sp.]|nr:thiamine phosphate synthase [Sphingomonas sp.]
MTDERMADGLWCALARLPRGSGVVFRHYATDDRRALFDRVRRIARKRRLLLLLAGTPREAIAWRADGAHGRSLHVRAARPLVRTASVHQAGEVRSSCADAMFVSPVFATRSHPGGRSLGILRFGLIAQAAVGPVIALGGMNTRRFRRLARLGAYGWAAVDALSPIAA